MFCPGTVWDGKKGHADPGYNKRGCSADNQKFQMQRAGYQKPEYKQITDEPDIVRMIISHHIRKFKKKFFPHKFPPIKSYRLIIFSYNKNQYIVYTIYLPYSQ